MLCDQERRGECIDNHLGHKLRILTLRETGENNGEFVAAWIRGCGQNGAEKSGLDVFQVGIILK